MADVTVAPPEGDSEVTLAVGETLAIRLPENPTTGHRWAIQRGSDLLAALDSTFEPPARPVAGAGGTRVIRVRASRAGAATLVVAYARPWDAGSVAGRRALHIEIRESRSKGG